MEDEQLDAVDIRLGKDFSVWGNPDAANFVSQYLTRVTFEGHSILWHKWAVIPLMAVQNDINAANTGYAFRTVETYNNRNIAGSNTKSNHAWALAMDINPDKNPMQMALVTDIPPAVRDAFKRHGFRWGGDYIGRKDTMHFEYMDSPVKGQQPRQYPTTAAMLDAVFLQPRHSVITGQMFMDSYSWYGVEVLWQLVITALETSIGSQGGGTKNNNFGNVKAGTGGKWEEFSDHTWTASGGTFLGFPTPQAGMAALGRFLKIGPSSNPGYYLNLFNHPPMDWTEFTKVYNPGGGATYAAEAKQFEDSFRATAAKYGFQW